MESDCGGNETEGPPNHSGKMEPPAPTGIPNRFFLTTHAGAVGAASAFFLLTMSKPQQYVAPGYSTRTYYILSDTFQRPHEFVLCTDYNGEIKAKTAFESAFHPCKVVQFIEPKEGMSYMKSPGVFNENGCLIPKG